MILLLAALIVAVGLIVGMIVLNRQRGFEGYKRRLPAAGKLSSAAADSGEAGDSSIYAPFVAGSTDSGSHHSHGSVDCGSSHGGDAGGGCSDGGGSH